jgi:hypothetical protein
MAARGNSAPASAWTITVSVPAATPGSSATAAATTIMATLTPWKKGALRGSRCSEWRAPVTSAQA